MQIIFGKGKHAASEVNGPFRIVSPESSRPGVLVIDSTGKEQAFIKTGEPNAGAREPAGNPSNVDFGVGNDKNVLYITVDKSLYRIRLNATGYHIPWAR